MRAAVLCLAILNAFKIRWILIGCQLFNQYLFILIADADISGWLMAGIKLIYMISYAVI